MVTSHEGHPPYSVVGVEAEKGTVMAVRPDGIGASAKKEGARRLGDAMDAPEAPTSLESAGAGVNILNDALERVQNQLETTNWRLSECHREHFAASVAETERIRRAGEIETKMVTPCTFHSNRLLPM